MDFGSFQFASVSMLGHRFSLCPNNFAWIGIQDLFLFDVSGAFWIILHSSLSSTASNGDSSILSTVNLVWSGSNFVSIGSDSSDVSPCGLSGRCA